MGDQRDIQCLNRVQTSGRLDGIPSNPSCSPLGHSSGLFPPPTPKLHVVLRVSSLPLDSPLTDCF